MVSLIIVADPRIAVAVQGKGGVLPRPAEAVNRFDHPDLTVKGGILQIVVSLIIVADPRITVAVQGKGGVFAHLINAINRFGRPASH